MRYHRQIYRNFTCLFISILPDCASVVQNSRQLPCFLVYVCQISRRNVCVTDAWMFCEKSGCVLSLWSFITQLRVVSLDSHTYYIGSCISSREISKLTSITWKIISRTIEWLYFNFTSSCVSHGNKNTCSLDFLGVSSSLGLTIKSSNSINLL